jgi:quinol monooxygenase YgiN
MSAKTYSAIVDLRMYTHQPGRRDDFIKLFEDQFIETQEAVGIQVIGQFYDLNHPNRCVWLRGFNDMSARKESLTAFYTGPIWKALRDKTNATLIDSDNVLLLRLAQPSSGFSLNGNRPLLGSHSKQNGFMTATIYYFDAPVDSDFIDYFEHTMKPTLTNDGASVLAYFVTEESPNTFPRLPVREGEHVFVWFTGFDEEEAHQSHLAELEGSKIWKREISKFLKKRLKGKPEIFRLAPSPRSRLTGRP